ncbi:MAG: HlyD family secretion protein [Acidocella sp.]|nr:HlyD family secretion protein [Acidocella sp.]
MSRSLVAGGRAVTGGGLPVRLVLLAGLVIVLVLAVCLFVYRYVTFGQYVQSTDDAYVGGDVTDIAPEVSGVITALAVGDNQIVHKGDLLVQIDDRDFAASLRRTQAAVAEDRAALANLAAQKTLQGDVIDQARAQLAGAKAAEVLAEANQARYRRLAATQAGSEQDAQTADANAKKAQAGVKKAQAMVAGAVAQLVVITTAQHADKAALAGVLADEDVARINLGDTSIRAPIDGVIGNRSAKLGGYASAGVQLVSIVPLRGLWVDANFKEDQIARIRPGQNVRIIADVLPGQRLSGYVQSVAPATGSIFSVLPAENATGNFTKIVQRVPVRIMLDGTSDVLGLLRPGMSVTANVNTK